MPTRSISILLALLFGMALNFLSAEIGLLVNQQHTDTLLFDTTAIHARQAVVEALKGA